MKQEESHLRKMGDESVNFSPECSSSNSDEVISQTSHISDDTSPPGVEGPIRLTS